MKYGNNQVTFWFLAKTNHVRPFYTDVCILSVATAETTIGQWMVYEHIDGGISRDELP